MRQATSGIVWAEAGGTYVHGYYALLSLRLTEFEDILDRLVLDIQDRDKN